jgi:hypothetical protein
MEKVMLELMILPSYLMAIPRFSNTPLISQCAVSPYMLFYMLQDFRLVQ